MSIRVYAVHFCFDAPAIAGRNEDGFTLHKKTKRSLPLDFVAGDSFVLVSEKVKWALSELDWDGITLAAVRVDGSTTALYQLSVNVFVDCLDRKESRVTYASDDPGKVLWVNRPELRLDCKHAAGLFRVPEMPSRLFCTRDFIDLVLKQKLTGVYFEDPKKELFGNPLPLFGTPLGMKLNPGVFKA